MDFNIHKLLIDNFGDISAIEVVDSGLVHHVYRIFYNNKIFYLKKRENKFAKLDIECCDKDIYFEYLSLTLYNNFIYGVFPNVLGFFENDNALLLSDVLESGDTLEELFFKNNDFINEELFSILGRTIASIHIKTRNIEQSPRGILDISFYKNELYYKLGIHNNKKLDKLAQKFLTSKKSLIIGDRSPKNIGVNHGKITFFDLDSTCMGNYEYEIGFIIAHICLHTRNSKCIKFINVFLSEYCKINICKINLQDVMLVSVGSMLYRLNSPVVPYNLGIDDNLKYKIVNNLNSILKRQNLTWNLIINAVIV